MSEETKTKEGETSEKENLKESFRKLDTDVLRAITRQRAHHTDRSMQRLAVRESAPASEEGTIFGMVGASRGLSAALEVLQERECGVETPDVRFAVETLERTERFAKEKTYPFSPVARPFDEAGLRAIKEAIYTRRSVRLCRDEDVPDELVKELIRAGQWAPIACGVQGVRYIVLKNPDHRKLIQQKFLAAAPVVIVVGVDTRFYSPLGVGKDNAVLDAGAAIENMLLMAHALGLATCWGTQANFSAIQRELQIPDYIRIVTYFSLGWPSHNPIPISRVDVAEVACKDGWGNPL